MKRSFLLFFFMLLSLATFAQSGYGNEWIKDNQKYIKIKVSEDGIYRITYSQLAAIGFLADNPNPKNFQLFYNGAEIPVYIEGESNLLFESGEFIEFYGKKNNGKLDEILYNPISLQPNPETSLYDDASYYFLTIGTTAGKRYTNTTLTNNGLSPEPFIVYTASANFAESYYPGFFLVDVMSLSEYLEGEGYLGNLYDRGNTQSRTLATPNAYNTSNFTPTLSYYVAGRSAAASTATGGNNHHLRISIGSTTLTDVLFKDYATSRATLNLAYNLINNTTTVNFSSIDDLGAATDYQAAGYARITYARSLDGANTSYLPFKVSGTNSEILLNFTNTSWNEVYILDETNQLRYTGLKSGNTTGFVVKNPGANMLNLYDGSNYKTPILENVTFALVKAASFNAKLLIVTNKKLIDGANEYATYKISKGYSTLVITTEELYNQFYYGQHHPLAIKNLVRYLLNNAVNKPEYLLLLGKGYETPKFKLDEDLVPTMGFPGSDSYLTSEIIDSNLAPALATGRVPAKTNDDVRIYLNKLKQYDLQPDSLWRKNIINISGGNNNSEDISFSAYLKSFSNIASKEYFGAQTISFYKSITDPVTDNLVGKVSDRINIGASLLTYLGHGSSTTTAVSVGSPSYLSNKGKLLFYLINGCSTGNAFTSGSMGENYIFQPEKGAIGWIGTSSEGIASYLSNFTTLFYQNSFYNNYGSSVAKNLQKSIRSYVNITDNLNKAHTRQYIYMGDPTIGFYAPDKPDYEITNQSIGFVGDNINASNTSLKLFVIIKNLGKSINQNVPIAVSRMLPDNTVINLPIQTPVIYHTDTLYFDIANDIANVAGNNKFRVTIDPDNTIQELNKTNNSAELPYYLAPGGLSMISPANFGIAGNTDISLKVQSNDFLKDNTEYLFEIDTLKDFSSNWKKTSGIISSGVLATWKPQFLPDNNKVYYWRAKLNNTNNEWQTSSFTYIGGSLPGWNQGHYQQFDNTSLYNIVKENAATFKYTPIPFPVLIRTRGVDAPASTERRIRLSQSGGAATFTDDFYGVSLIALNPNNLYDLFKYPSAYNSGNTGQFYFNTNNTSEADSLLTYLNKIPDGYYVVGMSGIDFDPNSLSNEIKSALQNLGLINFTLVNNGEPYAFWGRKGSAPGTAIEKTVDHSAIIPAKEQTIDYTYDFFTPGESGYYLSEKIGPSTKWSEVSFNLNKESTDAIDYSVIGIKENGTEVTTHNQLTSDNFSIANISAEEYPFIKLKVNTSNTTTKKLAQLKSWKVIYDGLPDVSFAPDLAKNFYDRVLQEGDSLKLSIGLSNLEPIKSDSVQVTYKITKSDRSVINGKIETTPPVSINNPYKLNFDYPTIGLGGVNVLQMNATPKNQKDKNEFNNYLTYSFEVKNDKKEPLVDVLFDNKRIINGEIVSPTPQIQISVSDENKFLLLKDTTSLELYIKEQNEQNFRRIAFSSNKVSIQGTGTNNNNKIDFLYLPEKLQDGIYTLKLRSKDASGNYNQTSDYVISFEVINEQTISNFLPYPNPFTTSMKFVFQVTGKIPDNIKIQIMTVSGKIVREIFKSELGPIQIGNNISTFTWDGTDQFGDRLANGVYFYNVIVENNDKSAVKHRANQTDAFFKKNFGKIYLMR